MKVIKQLEEKVISSRDREELTKSKGRARNPKGNHDKFMWHSCTERGYQVKTQETQIKCGLQLIIIYQ